MFGRSLDILISGFFLWSALGLFLPATLWKMCKSQIQRQYRLIYSLKNSSINRETHQKNSG